MDSHSPSFSDSIVILHNNLVALFLTVLTVLTFADVSDIINSSWVFVNNLICCSFFFLPNFMYYIIWTIFKNNS